MGWRDKAACAGMGPELFFVPRGGSSAEGLAVCDGNGGSIEPCPVRSECLDYAETGYEILGTWGGRTAMARRADRSEAWKRRKGNEWTV